MKLSQEAKRGLTALGRRKDKGTDIFALTGVIVMDKGLVMWIVFAAVLIVGVLVSRIIRNGIKKNGIEADAIVSRIVDDGTQMDIDISVYVRYSTSEGEEVEAVLSNPRTDLKEGQRVRIKYHPKMKGNARLV